MYRLVAPHDLEGECIRSCDGSIFELSQHTGISVSDLREFAAGLRPLSAVDRLHVFTMLVWMKTRWLSACDPELLAIALRHEPKLDAFREATLMSAVDHLWREAREELDEEYRLGSTKGEEHECPAQKVQ